MQASKEMQKHSSLTPLTETKRYLISTKMLIYNVELFAFSVVFSSAALLLMLCLQILLNHRNKTPIDSSASRNHTAGPKWRLLSGE
jgi:hypothetical protein